MPYFYCFSCHSIVTPDKPCTGPWHQNRKSKHMGVVKSNIPINKTIINNFYKKYIDVSVYVKTYGYGSCPLPIGFRQKSDLYWPTTKI